MILNVDDRSPVDRYNKNPLFNCCTHTSL